VKHTYRIFPSVALLFPCLLSYGCATQSDLQSEQQARESLRSQIVADSRSSLDEIRRELQQVRGEVEEMRYRLDLAARERVGTGPQLKILDDRIAVLEKQFKTRIEAPPLVAPLPGGMDPAAPRLSTESPGGTTSTGAVGGSPEPPSAPPSAPGAAVGQEETALARELPEIQDEYRTGLRALQERQYDRAIQEFRAFQRKYPSSEMADDAQYWIGESYFTQKDYNRAILEFNDVLKYRKGDRVPAALLRQAQAFIEIGDKTDARLILQKLLNDHPNSEEARDAKDRLQALGR
jgi:tol-pal system protein YbgF